MKIAIEAQRLFRKKKHGMEIVALEVIKELQKINTIHQFFILTKEDEDDKCIVATKNFRVEVLTSRPYPYWEQVLLPKYLKKLRPDILHCTANTAPLFCKANMIITIHDVIYMESVNFSGSTYQNFGNLYRKFIVAKVARKAKFIITVSNYEREVISKILKIDQGKIKVIYNGVNPQFKKIEKKFLQPFKNKYRLPDRFILHFGNTAPKKNTIGVLRAFSIYSGNNTSDYSLVITDSSRDYIESLLKEINHTGLINKIQILNYISFTEVPLLYNLATVFLYPSHRESFGMPIIESMACGVPVITSNTSALPEIAGGAALLADPKSAEDIAEKINMLISDDNIYSDYKEKGFKNALRFNWTDAAKQTLEIYKELA